jgi:hypothetical protein
MSLREVAGLNLIYQVERHDSWLDQPRFRQLFEMWVADVRRFAAA